jgi:hypothetical protein
MCACWCLGETSLQLFRWAASRWADKPGIFAAEATLTISPDQEERKPASQELGNNGWRGPTAAQSVCML